MDAIPLKALGLEKKWPRLVELQNELLGLQQHQSRASGLASTLHNEIPGAREKDLAEAAAAIRSGKDAPAENAHEREVEERLERARRDVAVYTRAVESVMSDIGAFRAQHQEALFQDVLKARQRIASEMSEAAAVASSAFAQYEDLSRLVKTLQPPAPVVEIGEPQRNTNYFVNFASVGMQGPPRGHVEAALNHLIELGQAGTSDKQQGAA